MNGYGNQTLILGVLSIKYTKKLLLINHLEEMLYLLLIWIFRLKNNKNLLL